MADTPERIWGHIDGDVGSWGRNWVFDEDVEYIRADLVEDLEAKLSKSEGLLAKAVEILAAIIDDNDNGMFVQDHTIEIARTTLAELKGEDRG